MAYGARQEIMERRQGANARSSPAAGCDWICDDAGIHKNLSPFGLRIFLAQEKMFFSWRIHGIRLRSEILFELSKSSATRQMRIFRGSLSSVSPIFRMRQGIRCKPFLAALFGRNQFDSDLPLVIYLRILIIGIS